MSKKYFLPLSLLIVVVLAGAGCAAKQGLKNKDNNLAKVNQNRSGGDFASSTQFMADRVKGTLDDLKEGVKIMAMGTANQDGTISASQIIIGDFNNFASSTRPNFASSTMPRQNGQIQRRQDDGSAGAGRQWHGGGQGSAGQSGAGGQVRARMTGQARVIGEIIKKDTIGLVVKINDGGSKIILYSDKTEIFSLASSTPPNLPSSASTGTRP